MKTASKKVINGWAMYDWANSAYNLVITSTIFPAYYTAVAPEHVMIGSRSFERAALASYSISLSFLIIALLSPVLSSIADSRGNKKRFMQFFCYMGSVACIGMVGFTGENVLFGLILSVIASIGYSGSIVFYNAYLPEIAAAEDQDRVSAKGFAMGYIGSVLLLLISLAFILANDNYNLGWGSWPSRISFVAVGIWWASFAQITFNRLPQTIVIRDETVNVWTKGFIELKKVWQQLQLNPPLKRFLRSFFFYNMGVQTVMYMATYFAADEIKLATSELIITILIIQVVAIGGAYFFSFLSQKTQNIFTLSVLIVIWIGICIFAYYTYSSTQFFILASLVGIVMGGIQSLSRSTYSKLLPITKDTASYFSFYDVCDKIGTVAGTLSFGFLAEIFGGMRNSVLALMIYFITGFILLKFVRRKKIRHAITQDRDGTF